MMSVPERALLPALGLLSAAALLLEVALARLLSTLYYPPYVFAVLSLAVLGLGLGAAAATARRSLRRPHYAPLYVAGAALSTLLVDAFAVWAAPLDLQPLLFLLVALPYAFVGLALAVLFAAKSDASPRLYLADLAGAGLGALLAVPALDLLGGVNAVLAAALLFALAGLLLSAGATRLKMAGVALLALLVVAGNMSAGFLQVNMATLASEKPIVESLQGDGRILETRWDAFARTDLVQPGDGGPYRIYLDGAAGSVMPPARENDFLWQDVGFFPFATEQPQQVFVIGPGGGLDVWFALQSNAQEIVAVEINGASTALVREYAPYNGDLYGQPGLRLVRDEGRSVLRREDRTYDLIFMSQVVTLAAERTGYALVEESAYTVQAFQDYLDHLAPDGQLALKLYDEPTLTRALATTLETLNRRGLDDAQALTHVIALVDPRAQPPVPLLVVSNSPFTREDSLSLGAVARQVGFTPLYLPHVMAQPPLDAVAAGDRTFAGVIAQADADVSPTVDDRPFFYQFERGLPQSLERLLLGLAPVYLAGALLLLLGWRGATPGFVRRSPLYFAALGLGFMVVEVAVIQQTRLFLGHPTLAVTAVLATLLIGGGLGSAIAGRRWPARHRPPALPALAVALLALVWLLLWPVLSDQFLAAGRAPRVGLVILSLLPLALCMGMPFPLGLRAAGLHGQRPVALAWAVNGLMTVAGSVLAVTIAMLAGFSRVLLLGLLAYTLAALLARGLRRS